MYDLEEHVEVAKPNPCKTCCYFIWKLVTCIFSHIILVSLVVAYCILGAFTFETLESGHEVQVNLATYRLSLWCPTFRICYIYLNLFQVKAGVSAVRAAVSNRLWNMTKNVDVLRQENWTREVKEYLKEFETDLLTAMKKNGWDGTEDEEVTQWTFAGALFYSIIVITTIGKSFICPRMQLSNNTYKDVNNESAVLNIKMITIKRL